MIIGQCMGECQIIVLFRNINMNEFYTHIQYVLFFKYQY
jgi:hypothetical protein